MTNPAAGKKFPAVGLCIHHVSCIPAACVNLKMICQIINTGKDRIYKAR
jgi:hypothetical protein